MIIYGVHKIWRRTQWRTSSEIDVQGETAEIEQYEAELAAQAERTSLDVLRIDGEGAAAEPIDPKNASALIQFSKKIAKVLDRAGFVLY